MSIPPLPPHLENIGRQHFAFYPAILGIEHNEWLYSSATWSEIQVINAQTGAEVWIPRRFVGEVSRIDEPILIVGLNRELEFKLGAVWPHKRRIIEFPIAVNDPYTRSDRPVSTPLSTQLNNPGTVVNIRTESPNNSRTGRLVVGVVVLAVVGFSVVIGIARNGRIRPRQIAAQSDQSYLELNRNDDYFSIVRKLGTPAGDSTRRGSVDLTYRALDYPTRRYTVILMGRTSSEARYLGTLDRDRRVLDSARFPAGGDGAAMLRALPPF